ncbi:MAG: DUF3131 domain-containing protein [Propionibacteriaceae bacterium]|nr:DUF3131 domain-containing protein [Propionibacteriaceae bacterium]
MTQSAITRRSMLIGGAALAASVALPPPSALAKPTKLPPGQRKRVLGWARDTWRSLVAMADPDTGLVADNIPGNLRGRAVYTSPTNLGGYLWSALVARELEIIGRKECSARIRKSLATLEGMEHHTASGMYFNWYDPRDGSVIYAWPESGDPVVPFVSSIDAAWLGAALLCVRNGDRANAGQAGEMFARMRFDVFADPTFDRPYLNYGGFYLVEPTDLNNPPPTVARDLIGAGSPVWYTRDHHYDTVVSETRITTYLGIAKGQIPGSSYYQSWRTFPPDWTWPEMPPEGRWRTYLGVDVFEGTHSYGRQKVVPGWGGSMFEELMPDVFVPEETWAPKSWGRNHPRHVDAQIHHGLKDARYGYWGFSPASDPYGGYAEWGVDALGLKPDGYFSDHEHTDYLWDNPPTSYGDGVVTPHAAFLAMMHRPNEAVANLRKLERDFDSYGRGGFYDAIAVRSGRIARRYLSLDQAMILGALGNVLGDGVLRRYFTKGEVAKRVRPVIAPEVFGA